MKQIICIGSGGLDHENPLLDLYVVAQSTKPNPKVLLLPTASGDNDGLIKYFEKFYNRFPCRPSHLSLFNPSIKNVRKFILSHDIIFVSGGHTLNALVLWKHYGIDKILKDAYDKGIILAGGSAGSVCWFDECITDSFARRLSVMPCLGILPFSNCPHYSSEHRRAAYEYFMKNGQVKDGYAIDDGAALHFIDGQVFRSVSAADDKASYECRLNIHNGFVQSKINTHFLGNPETMNELIWQSVPFSAIEENTENATDNSATCKPTK